MIVRGWEGQPSVEALEREAESGKRPRTPYVALARALDADVIDSEFLQGKGRGASRLVGRRLGTVEGQVLETFFRRRGYRRIVAFADRIGLELALLLKFARSRRDLVMVSNWLMSDSKRQFFDRGHVQSHIGTIVGYGSVQLTLAAARYGFSPEQLHLALQPVDEHFWRPTGGPVTDDLICSVGCVSGFRDYATLIAATRDLPVRVQLAVGSLILSSGHRRTRADLFRSAMPPESMPSNITHQFDLTSLELRDLYARSRFVVIPLEDVDFDAGVTSITEAMAMGKAVIATRSKGQVDVLHDGVEGLYVPPKDPAALRAAIEFLLTNPDEATRMGAAGRAAVLERHRLDDWAGRVSAIALADTAI